VHAPRNTSTATHDEAQAAARPDLKHQVGPHAPAPATAACAHTARRTHSRGAAAASARIAATAAAAAATLSSAQRRSCYSLSSAIAVTAFSQRTLPAAAAGVAPLAVMETAVALFLRLLCYAVAKLFDLLSSLATASGAPDVALDAGVASAAVPDAPAAAAAPHVAATPALRADVERLASQLDDWGRRYLTRDWKPALDAVRVARDELDAVFDQLSALTEPAELLSVAAPLGATGFKWAVELPVDESFIDDAPFHDMARALHEASMACGVPETVQASCDLVVGRSFFCECCEPKARALLERALGAFTRNLGAGSHEALDAQYALGHFHYHRGRYAAAEAALQPAYEGRKRLLGPDDPSTLTALYVLANSHVRQGRGAAGEALMREAQAGLEAALGPDHPHVLNTVLDLGTRALRLEDYPAAERHLRRALKSSAAGLGPDHSETQTVRRELARTLLRMQRFADAGAQYGHLARHLSRTRGPGHEKTLDALAFEGTCLQRSGQQAAALALVSSALPAARAELGAYDGTTVQFISVNIDALSGLGRKAAAVELAERELPGIAEAMGPDHPIVLKLTALLRRGRGAGRRRLR
jgi:tetratricopeptide (TPR) repeat protein